MKLHIHPDAAALSLDMAGWIAADVAARLAVSDRYSLVLSGGNTPRQLYERLAAAPFKDQIDWKKIHLFWGDERYVPFSDERHNGRMAYETLIRHVPVPKEQVHYMDTALAPPDASAHSYEALLYSYFDGEAESFDLVLLGMGDDGHTLSLFPGSPVIEEKKAWVAAPFVPAQDMYRITLTAPVVNRARAVAFMVTGAGKAEPLREVVSGPYTPEKWPSQVIQPGNGRLHLFADQAAARLIS